MSFTKIQQEQVEKQLERHKRKDLIAKIPLNNKNNFLEIEIDNGVFGSDIMSSGIYLAKFLYSNKKLYKNKFCLDMGCGPGTQGLIMSKYGAKQVILTDISKKAVINTIKNIKRLNLKNSISFESDLFNNIPINKFDVIVFNHPFFPGEASKHKLNNNDTMLRKSMLGGTKLVKKFFKYSKNYLKNNGIIIMPYFHFAGKENDPANHVKKFGLRIKKEKRIKSSQGLQLGDFSIYVISK